MNGKGDTGRPLTVLFVLRHYMYLRNYESTLRLLAAHGHRVVVGYQEVPEKVTADIAALAECLPEECPSISLEYMPARADVWAKLAYQVRALRNFLRYREPDLSYAVKCAARAEEHVYKPLRRIARRAGPGGFFLRLLMFFERVLPLDREAVRAVQRIRPDVVVVSPLVELGSSQVEFVKAARYCRVPCVHAVASWDNLTNKGIVPLQADRMLVWNEAQRQEAIGLHGVAAARIVVTGAQLFDAWFERKPSTTREAFCERAGLDPGRPFILYTASSVFIAKQEAEFVSRWLEAKALSPDARLREAGVMIRPHPGSTKFAAQWRERLFAQSDNVTVFPPQGGYPVNEAARADYFDSLYHAGAVVGINTSAMLEAAIIGRPCLTVLDPAFRDSQEGMVHFAHLTRGGYLQIGQDMDDHMAALAAALGGGKEGDGEARDFVAHFLRPGGLDRAATPQVVGAIETAAALEPQGLARWPRLLAPVLFPAALYLNAATAGRRTKKWDKSGLRGAFKGVSRRYGGSGIVVRLRRALARLSARG